MKLFTTLLLLCSLVSASVSAQGVFSNNTNAALQRVIQDYPNNYRNIKGELLTENPQTVDYRSKVEIPGSAGCILTHYSSSKKEVYSWKADLFEEEDFEKTKLRFKELYNQIRNTIVKIEGEKPFILNGAYQSPTEEKKFTTILFQLLPSGGEMDKLKVELSMNYVITGWKITLTVYDHEHKEEEFSATGR